MISLPIKANVFTGTSQVTVEINEMEKYSITCSLKPDMSLTVMWLRATEKNGVEFIVSYKSKNKSWGKEFGQSMDTSDGYKLTIKSFNKETDSGIYNCATYNANRLTFGTSTVLKEKQGGFILNSFLCVFFVCFNYYVIMWYYMLID